MYTQNSRFLLAGVVIGALTWGVSALAQQGYVAHFEGESLVSVARSGGGHVFQQNMLPFGQGWSGNSQLAWVPPAAGNTLTLTISVRHAGTYSLAGYFTKAKNCGRFQMHINGARVGHVFNAYDPDVKQSGRIEFGSANLRAGNNTVMFSVVGKDNRSIGFVVGIDGLAFTYTDEPPKIIVGPVIVLTHKGQMLSSITELNDYLSGIDPGGGWKGYLRLDELKTLVETNVPEKQSAVSAAKIRDIANRLTSVSQDPNYRAFFQRRPLHSFRVAMDAYNAKLPAPGTNIPGHMLLEDKYAKAAKELEALGGKPIVGKEQAWFFDDLGGYHRARELLRDGVIRDCQAIIWKPSGNFEEISYAASPGFYTLKVIDEGAKITIYRGQRGKGKAEGSARCEVLFKQPVRMPNGKADPKCPLLKPGWYERAIHRQEQVTDIMRGPTGGLFVISASELGEPVKYTLEPSEDDILIAYDEAQRRNAWGKTFTHKMLVRVSAMYHAHNPVTTKIAGGWKVDNRTQLIKPHLVVELPCTVVCVP